MSIPKVVNNFSTLLGIFFLIEGIWGMFSPVVLGILSTNTLHATIHIILGVLGVWQGKKGTARSYCLFAGMILLVVGIFRFIPKADDVIIDLLNVNTATGILNIIVGIIAIAISFIRSPALKTN